MQNANKTAAFFLLKGIPRIAAEANTPNSSNALLVSMPNTNSSTGFLLSTL